MTRRVALWGDAGSTSSVGRVGLISLIVAINNELCRVYSAAVLVVISNDFPLRVGGQLVEGKRVKLGLLPRPVLLRVQKY